MLELLWQCRCPPHWSGTALCNLAFLRERIGRMKGNPEPEPRS